MEFVEKNNVEEASLYVVKELAQYDNQPYLVVLSGDKNLLDFYTYMSRSFDYTFPPDLCLAEETFGIRYHQSSSEYIIRESGMLGRARWERSLFHPVLEEGISDPEYLTHNYKSRILSLFDLHQGNIILIANVDEEGSTLGYRDDEKLFYSNELLVRHSVDGKEKLGISLKFLEEFVTKTVILAPSQNSWDLMRNSNDIGNKEIPSRKYWNFNNCKVVKYF